MEDDEFANYQDLLPESAVPTIGVTVCQFIDEDGDHAFAVTVAGAAPVSSHVGLIELAKQFLIDTYQKEDP